MGTVGSLVFTGISSYSSDFQTILQREVSIAQLPVKALQNQQTDNLSKKQALVALDPAVASLGSAVAALGTIASGQGLTATSSDSTTVSVINTGAAAPANYTISNITLAKPASETSLTGYADSTSTPVWVAGQNKFDLVVGSNTYHLDLTGNNNLNGLQNAINTSGAPVSASVIVSGNGNYLALSANNVGATTLTLSGIPQQASLITNNGTGIETSTAGYATTGSTAVSNSGTVDLTVGGGSVVHLDVSGANNNLTGLMNAINTAGAGVTASIVTSGGTNHLQLDAGGPTSITLEDTPGASPVSLISNTNQGGNADFMLNGTIHVNQASNVFSNVIPGVSFSLLQANPGTVNLSVAADSSQLTNALATFTQSYNALVDQVNQQIGSGGGVLTGDVLIRNISDDLRQLTSYSPGNSSSSVRSLYDLGITFDTTGHLSFDSTVTSGYSTTQIADAFKFLGSSSSGFSAFANNFTQLSDPLEGAIRIQEDGYDSANLQLTNQISVVNDRATAIQSAVTAQLQMADALVAQLQSTQNTINASVQSLNYVLYGKQTNSNGL